MAAPMKTIHRKYLFQFAHEHLDFRIPELQSILDLFNIKANIPVNDLKDPFITLDLTSDDDARKIASRSVLIRSVFELWSKGKTEHEMYSGIRALPKSFIEPYITSQQTYKYQVSSFNKSLTNKEKVRKIENLPFDVLDFQGKVDLKNAVNSYYIIEHYGPFGHQPTEEPVDLYFGKWLADGQRDRIREYHLQKRHFIANTSMDAGLSMIMANIGKIQRNMLMMDPFVGSGSLLVAAAHFGAYVMGTDIDYLLLHAKARPSRCNEKKRSSDESIRSNLRQYGTEHLYVDALVADSSRDSMWREQPLFDAIITDPPYGIREGAKKVASKSDDEYINGIQSATGDHIAKRQDYHLSDIFKDLLNFSAKYLHKHGRLVYWFPVSIKDYREENIPTHRCLQLVHNSEQPLNSKVARRLITMEKILDYSESIPDAEVRVDHFEESTFREMYFSDSKLEKERNSDVEKTRELTQTLNVNDT